jgi:hypothetical protein
MFIGFLSEMALTSGCWICRDIYKANMSLLEENKLYTCKCICVQYATLNQSR